MLKVTDLIEFLTSLKDQIDEGTRTVIVGQLARTITAAIQRSGDEKLLTSWHANGKLRFIRDCGLLTPSSYLPASAKVKPGALAPFYAKWMQCNTFKLKDKERPITPPQNALRVAMLTELRELLDKP